MKKPEVINVLFHNGFVKELPAKYTFSMYGQRFAIHQRGHKHNLPQYGCSAFRNGFACWVDKTYMFPIVALVVFKWKLWRKGKEAVLKALGASDSEAKLLSKHFKRDQRKVRSLLSGRTKYK